MGHTRSQNAYMLWCMDEYEDRYIKQAEELAKNKKLTVFYRETIRIEYSIKRRRLINEIFDSQNQLRSGSTAYGFKTKTDDYIQSMIFDFALHESQAREIYNEEKRQP